MGPPTAAAAAVVIEASGVLVSSATLALCSARALSFMVCVCEYAGQCFDYVSVGQCIRVFRCVGRYAG